MENKIFRTIQFREQANAHRIIEVFRVLWLAIVLLCVPRGVSGQEADYTQNSFWAVARDSAKNLKNSLCPEVIAPEYATGHREAANFQTDKANCHNLADALEKHAASSKALEDQTAKALQESTQKSTNNINDKSSKDLCDLLAKYASKNTFGQLSPEIGITEDVKKLVDSFQSKTYNENTVKEKLMNEYASLARANGTKGLSGLALAEKSEECSKLSAGGDSLQQKPTDDRSAIEKYGPMAAQALGPIAGLLGGGKKEKDKGDPQAPFPPSVPTIDSSSGPTNIGQTSPSNGFAIDTEASKAASDASALPTASSGGVNPSAFENSRSDTAFNAASNVPASNGFGSSVVSSSPGGTALDGAKGEDANNTSGASQAPGATAVASAESETEAEGGNGKLNGAGALDGLDDSPLPDFMSGLKAPEPDMGPNSVDFGSEGSGLLNRNLASVDKKEKNKLINLAMTKGSIFFDVSDAIRRSCSRGNVRCQ